MVKMASQEKKVLLELKVLRVKKGNVD